MFGVGPQEMVIIGLLLLIVFGPGKLPGMARDLGRFVNQARGYIDEYKSELVSDVEDETPELETMFDLEIYEDEMTPDEIVLDEGDQVTLRVLSDRPVELHLRGYGLSAEISPSDPVELSFAAKLTGRFEIEDHSSDPHQVLGEVLVEPR